MARIAEPFPIFFDDDGTPLDNGMIYIGEVNENPRANPVQVFYDEARTLTATQPIRTLNGRPAFQGAPARLYIAEREYSIEVHNRFGTPVTGQATGESVVTEAFLAATTGAALVGTIASGTGAVARDVQAKLAETVSVKDFGAVGDGAADDSTAFANTIAAGREVYIPAGTYRITPRTFSNLLSLKIRGAGRDVTKLILTSTGTALTFSNCQWLQLSDFSMETEGGAQVLANANGIELNTGSSNCIIERINIYGFSLDGLRLIGTSGSPLSGNTVKDVYILGCSRHQAREFWNNDATWDNCQFGRLAGVTRAQVGWFTENCGENGAVNVKLWENTVGFRGLNNLGMRYVGCRFEESQEKNCDLDGCDDVQFSGCRMYSGSKAGDGLHDYFYATNCDRLQIVGCNINTWDASFGRWAVNIDSGCNDLTFKSNVLGGFSASFGPIRIAGGVVVDGDLVLPFTASGVAAGATVYPSRGAVTAEAAAFNSLPRRFAAVSLYAGTIAAPGAGETFTYTLRRNAVDTAMAGASSGASSFSANAPSSTPQILFASGDFSSVKLVASAAATVTDHRGYVVLVAY